MEKNEQLDIKSVDLKNVESDKDYVQWFSELRSRYHSAQIKAAVKVNSEKLLFNWQLGRDLVLRKAEERWGTGIVKQVALDLQREFPNDGFSARNIMFMKQWFLFYAKGERKEKVKQLVSLLQTAENQNLERIKQIGSIVEDNVQTDSDLLFPSIFGFIPWGHHIAIIQQCVSVEEACFYIQKTVEENWSRNTLIDCIKAKMFAYADKYAINNFSETLPKNYSKLVEEITKENYDFGFLTLPKDYEERDLENALSQYLESFMLELGTGFAFIGRQKEIIVAGKTRRIDLLFYHIRLRCYVVVELKSVAFEPEFAGKLNYYVNAVNHLYKTDEDNPTIGLLICRSKDQTDVQLSFEGITSPLGVASYDNVRIKEIEKLLPTVSQLEERIKMLEDKLNQNRE